MKVEKKFTAEGRLERRLLIGMIVSRAVAAAVAQHWTPLGLFQSRPANLVGSWCVAHYRKFGKPLGRQVQVQFDHWEAEGGQRKEDVEFVKKLLAEVSDDYVHLKKSTQAEHLIDLAGRFFTKVRIERAAEEAKNLAGQGRLDKALTAMEGFRKVEMGMDSYSGLHNAKEKIRQALAPERFRPLITFGSEALDNFFGRHLGREQFVCFEGPEKSGKCVAGGTKVLLADGSVRTIREIVKSGSRPMVLSLDEKTGLFVPIRVGQLHSNGRQECFRIKTRTGRSITATANHQFLTPDGWKPILDIRSGEYVAVPKRAAAFGKGRMPDDEIKFLAYMLAEGGCTSHQAVFTNTDPTIVGDFHKTCHGLGIGYTRKGISSRLTGCGWLRRKYPGALWKVSSKTKLIPPEVFSCPKDQIALFLRIFFSCDGYVSKCGRKIGLSLSNRRMLQQISHLLIRFGIVHRLRSRIVSCNGKWFRAWCLDITDAENSAKFMCQINMLSYKYREPTRPGPGKSFLDKLPWQIADRLYQRVKSLCPTVPRYGNPAGFTAVMGGKKKTRHIRWQVCQRKPLMRKSFAAIRHKTVAEYLHSDVLWDQVKSITPVGKKEVFDIGVPGRHNFVANDFVVHNSWWLQEVAYLGVTQGHNVAHFAIGDMTENDMWERLAVRMTGKPSQRCIANVPKTVSPPAEEKGMAGVTHDEVRFKTGLTTKETDLAVDKLWKAHGKHSFRLSVHPNNTVTVDGIRGILERWDRQGWNPDIIVIDYADLIAPLDGKMETRDQINLTWQRLRAVSQTTHALLVTASQTDAASYDVDLIGMKNFSGDKRKNAHVTMMVAINRKEKEVESGLFRLNRPAVRAGKNSVRTVVHVAGCLDIGRPAILSTF